VGRSEREAEIEHAEAPGLPENENVLVSTQNKTSSGKDKPAVSHSYNLRSRVDSTQGSMQE